ncbi:hypothetical protein C2S51_015343 [Perilla frutescens var. frutescens]|nr:hypothetical protein C2S51_015343 [Perilla frutescens var. frutescens]
MELKLFLGDRVADSVESGIKLVNPGRARIPNSGIRATGTLAGAPSDSHQRTPPPLAASFRSRRARNTVGQVSPLPGRICSDKSVLRTGLASALYPPCALVSVLWKCLLPVLDDFQDWKTKIECILVKEKIYKAITTKIDKSVDDEKFHEMNDSARATILLNLCSTVVRKVSHHQCAKELWDNLISLYTAASEESMWSLQNQFMSFQMDSSKDIDANMDEFYKLLQDLKLAGDDSLEKYAPQVLLGSIPESFAEVKSALKYGGSKVNCDMIVTGLKAKESEMRKMKSQPLHNEIMYVNRNNNRNPPHGFDKPPNPENPSVLAAERHMREMNIAHNLPPHTRHHNHAQIYSQNSTQHAGRNQEFTHQPQNQNSDMRPRKTCWNCGKPGHFSNRCKMPKKNKAFGNYDHRANHVYEGANNVHEDTVNYDYYDGDGIYMVHTAYDFQFINYSNAVSKDMHENEWLIDSGCTFHVTPHKHMFHNLQYLNSGHVALADGQHCEIIGKGDICLKFANGSMLLLSDVRYVPQLKFNLLSVSKMADNMLDGSVNSLRFKFEKDSVLYFIAPRKGDLSVPGFKTCVSRDVTFNEHDFPCLPESSPYVAPSEVENLKKLDNNVFEFMSAPPVASSEVEDNVENVTPMPSESENVTNDLPVTEHESENHNVEESVSEHEANDEPINNMHQYSTTTRVSSCLQPSSRRCCHRYLTGEDLLSSSAGNLERRLCSAIAGKDNRSCTSTPRLLFSSQEKTTCKVAAAAIICRASSHFSALSLFSLFPNN